jgi:hypothetical protein
MTYTPITIGEIATGQPVQSSTLNTIKENFESFNDRITAIEGGSSAVYPPLIFRVNGDYGDAIDFEVATQGVGLLKTTLNFGITIIGVRILIDVAGTSGTTEIDLKFKRGVSSYASIFNTRPSVVHSAGNDNISSNAAINPSANQLEAGDILRLDLLDAQVAAKNFIVRVDYIKS